MSDTNFVDIDPQRVIDSEDVAFFGATIYRSLESFVVDPDPIKGTTLQPDLATDLGTATDGGKTWSFTLRDGVTWQDGSAISCADVAYGVSREFATDIMGGGPSYAIQYLDIPYDSKGASMYPGPYKATADQQALFDKAVVCSGNTITFHLNSAHGDFNYATTLGMDPVPNPTDHKGVDIGEGYGITTPPFASGPYMVESYSPGAGGTMKLVRNPKWNQASDPIRPAYPDNWEVDFGIDAQAIDQRLMASAGNDASAIGYGQVQEPSLSAIFSDAHMPNAAYAGRAVSALDPAVRYLWVNVTKVPELQVRQAIAVALDRAAIRAVFGGDFHGDFADGVVRPGTGQDYAPTGIWDTFFGGVVPAGGDPILARRLIEDSGAAPPKVRLTFPNTQPEQRAAAIVVSSLGLAGITVELLPTCPGFGCKVEFEPAPEADFGSSRWAADWPNASTVIPSLFTIAGGWDFSKVNDATFNAAVADALGTLDGASQALKWQALNRTAVAQAWAIPLFFERSQHLAGTRVQPIYRWPAYSSWPYAEMSMAP